MGFGGEIVFSKEFLSLNFVCPQCSDHVRYHLDRKYLNALRKPAQCPGPLLGMKASSMGSNTPNDLRPGEILCV